MDIARDADHGLMLPRYDGPSLVGLVPGLFGLLDMAGQRAAPEWLVDHVGAPERVVLLVLDGLGYLQLMERRDELPTLGALRVLPALSTAPTTTTTALTSLTTGAVPAVHGVLGYRVVVGPGSVLNVLRWTLNGRGPAPAPERLAPVTPFLGANPVAVTKFAYADTCFTKVHLRGARLAWWSTLSQIVTRIDEALGRGERFVYAYYEGIDTTAHEFGLDEAYHRELRMVDAMTGLLMERLPQGVTLVITADHGEVAVDGDGIRLDRDVRGDCSLVSGEGRFRWLHTVADPEAVAERCRARYGDVAEVFTRDEAVAAGLFGGPVSEAFLQRLGDVALVATAPVFFDDPADQGALKMRARHGALTPAEVLVPIAVGP